MFLVGNLHIFGAIAGGFTVSEMGLKGHVPVDGFIPSYPYKSQLKDFFPTKP